MKLVYVTQDAHTLWNSFNCTFAVDNQFIYDLLYNWWSLSVETIRLMTADCSFERLITVELINSYFSFDHGVPTKKMNKTYTNKLNSTYYCILLFAKQLTILFPFLLGFFQPWRAPLPPFWIISFSKSL